MPARRRYYPSRRSRGGRRVSSSNRRSNLWIRNVAGVFGQEWVRSGFDLIPASELDPGARVGSTAVRLIGSLNVIQESATPNLDSIVYFGVLVSPVEGTPDQAFNNPSIDPLVNRNQMDWMFWKAYPLNEYSTAFSNAGATLCTYPIDIKSSRRLVSPQDTVNVYITFSPGNSTMVSMNWWITSSLLLKLS